MEKAGISRKRYDLVDLNKFVFAICIVALHTKALSILPAHVEWVIEHMIFRLAVPFYFVMSAYFLSIKIAQNENDREEVFKAYRKRLLPSYLTWSTVGLIFMIIEDFRVEHRSILEVVLHIIRTEIFYPRSAMWFVLACMVASWIIQKLYNNKKTLICIAVLGYLFALTCNSYYWVFEGTIIQKALSLYLKFCVSPRNGLFVGLPFMLIGFYIPQIVDRIKHRGGHTWTVISGISIILYLLEILWLFGKHTADDDSLLIFTPLVIIVLVYWTLQSHISIPNALTLRKISTCLYYFHAFYLYLYNLCVLQNINKFAFVFIMSSISAAVIIKGKISNKWILP